MRLISLMMIAFVTVTLSGALLIVENRVISQRRALLLTLLFAFQAWFALGFWKKALGTSYFGFWLLTTMIFAVFALRAWLLVLQTDPSFMLLSVALAIGFFVGCFVFSRKPRRVYEKTKDTLQFRIGATFVALSFNAFVLGLMLLFHWWLR